MNWKSIRVRLWGAVLAVSLGVSIGALPQAAIAVQDQLSPVLVASSVTPLKHNLADGPAEITISVDLTDVSGATAPVVEISHGSAQSYGFGSMTLVKGNAQKGTWQRKVSIPQGAATGAWEVSLWPLFDTVGNIGSGFQTLGKVTLTNSERVPDMTPPVLGDYSITPTDHNLADGPAEITISVDLTDVSGAAAPVVEISHGSAQSYGFGSMTLVKGTAQNGTWQRKVTIPKSAATGVWEVSLWPVGDTFGNLGSGFQTLGKVTLTNSERVPDMTPPVLGDYSITPTDHNLADGPAEITISVDLTDVSGAAAPVVEISHGSAQSYGFGSMTLVKGTAQNGTWQRKISIPQGASTGAWEVSLWPLFDTVGNNGSGFQTLGKVTLTNQRPLFEIKSAVPRITGTPAVGNTLTAVPGVWSPVGVELDYQWSAAGTQIKDATKNTLTLTPELAGKAMTVAVTGTKAGFTTTTKSSIATAKVAPAVLTWKAPSIAGTPTVGNTLIAVPGKWGPTGVELAYQWSAGGTKIKDATQNTLALDPSLVGKAITVAVTGTKAGYTTTTKSSHATAMVSPARIRVAAAAPTSVTATGRYTVPSTQGVDYRVDGSAKKAGTYASGYTKVTITAVAKPGYVLSGTTSWTLDLTRKTVTAIAPSVNYTSKTITLPRLTGVAYSIDGVSKAAGKHKVTTNATVIAKASAANYVVAAKSWKYDLRTAITPSKPVFSAAKNTVKIPAKTGVTYYVNNVLKKAGTHKYTGSGKVTTKASSGSYKLAGTTSWMFDNRNAVAPTKPVFNAAKNTVKIPAKTGVTYYINGVLKKAGTHKYTGKVTVTTKAANGSYKLAGTQKWSARL